MRDEGLARAIEAAGGVGALARGLGISQPSVSAWSRVPADRVIAVERVTGVRREALRPDLYDGAGGARAGLADDEVERARAAEYFLLARLLRAAPSAQMLGEIARIKGDASPLGMSHLALADAAARASEADVASEFFTLFIGIGRGELLPYGSFYLTGFLHERPLARLRQDLARLGIERAEGNFDPEDNLGLLLETMGGFADGTFEADLATQKAFFGQHILPWAAKFFEDLSQAPSARFYKSVAAVGREFMTIETEAFSIEE